MGDREFASATLFNFFNKQGVAFYIRIKEGALIKVNGKKWGKAERLFRRLNTREKAEFQMTVSFYGQKVFLAGSRSERGELMIVATNQTPGNAIAIYLRRWEIECLFACLKGRNPILHCNLVFLLPNYKNKV